MIVRTELFYVDSKLPKKAHKDDACFDLFINNVERVSNNKVTVELGFGTEIPRGFKAIVVPRSSLTHKSWFMANSPAQIDSNYRGEWKLKFEATPRLFNLLEREFPYKVGDRVAQCYFERVENVKFEIVDKLNPSDRGEGGFGSTGK